MIDELEAYLLNKYPHNFICGTKNCNILLWGIKNNYNIIPKMFTLNVGFSYNPQTLDKSFITDQLNQKYSSETLFKNMYLYCKHMSIRSKLPFLVIVYPSLTEYQNEEWTKTPLIYPFNSVCFYIKSILTDYSSTISGEQLVNYIYKILGVNYTDKGTDKAENKRIHDYFQFWSRNNLSTSIKKIDCDGILANNTNTKHILLEIKRSSRPPIPQWKPYVDDANNYINHNSFAQILNCGFWLLQHEGKKKIEPKSKISFYNISSTNTQEIIRLRRLQKNTGKKQYGDYLICKEQIVPLAIDGTHSLVNKINSFIIS